MIQEISGTVKNSAGAAWADALVEIQLDGGTGQITGLAAVGVTDAEGLFAVNVYNNASTVKRCLVRLPDDSLFSFDLDPEEEEVSAGTLRATGGSGQPRLTQTTPSDIDAAVAAAVAALVDGSPAALNTLNELAAALGDDQAFATTVTNALAAKLASADFTSAAVTAKLLTGFVAGAGTVAATDTILQALNKIVGNLANKLDADISALDAAVPVSADIFAFRTVGGVWKKVALADLATAIDGELNP